MRASTCCSRAVCRRSEQEPDRTQVVGATVDQRRLRAAERVSAEDVRARFDARDPCRDEPRMLPCRHCTLGRRRWGTETRWARRWSPRGGHQGLGGSARGQPRSGPDGQSFSGAPLAVRARSRSGQRPRPSSPRHRSLATCRRWPDRTSPGRGFAFRSEAWTEMDRTCLASSGGFAPMRFPSFQGARYGRAAIELSFCMVILLGYGGRPSCAGLPSTVNLL